MTPVEKLEKYADGENIFNRQMVARTVLETLRQVLEDKGGRSLNASSESCEAGTEEEAASRPGAEVSRVFSVVELLARDTEATVRAELMEQVCTKFSPKNNKKNNNIKKYQVPHIAMFCQEQETQVPGALVQASLSGVVPTHLLPLVVRWASSHVMCVNPHSSDSR